MAANYAVTLRLPKLSLLTAMTCGPIMQKVRCRTGSNSQTHVVSPGCYTPLLSLTVLTTIDISHLPWGQLPPALGGLVNPPKL